MRKPIAFANLIWMACCATFGQNAPAMPAAPAPEFEVASVKPVNDSGGFSYSVNVIPDPAFLRITGMSLENLIEWAYGLKPFQVSGPGWMKSERYDIVAKMPAGAKQDRLAAMLQTLLEQRFQLEVHRESKVLPVYALVVSSGGLKMHPSKTGQGGNTQWGPGHMEAHKTRLSDLALSLSGVHTIERPVLDETGVQEVFDFTLDWAEDEEHEAAGIPPIRTVLEEKLGLKLEPRKLPVEMLVIDHVEKKPSEN